MRLPFALAALLVLPAAAAPAAAGISFQARRAIELGAEPTAAALAGGGAVLFATTNGLATLSADHGDLVRSGGSRDGRGATVLAVGHGLAAYGNRETPRIAIAALAASGQPGAAREIELPAVPRSARIAPLADGGEPAVVVLHDAGLSLLVRDGSTWQRRDLAAPRFAADVEITDLDGDRRADLVLVDEQSGTLAVMRGGGDGSFEPATSIASARQPRRLVSRDTSGDGRADLLVIGAEGVFLHRLTADGRLSPPQPVWSSPHVADVAVADLSGDGRPDLIVADRSAGAAVVLLAGGDGRYAVAGSYLLGPAPEALLADDVDADGHVDLVAFGRLGGGATWMRGRGDGTFDGMPCTVSTFGAPSAMVSDDFDGDEHPDLAAVSEDSGRLGIFLGSGDGRFRALPPIDVGRRPRGITVGDFNRDDVPDLAVVVFGGDTVAVLIGDGRGGFAAPRHVTVGHGPIAISTGSFANPASVDLAVVNSMSDSVTILYGDGRGQFPTVASHDVAERPSFLIVGDTNGDGHQDLVVGSTYSESVAILLGNGQTLDPPTTNKLAGTAKPSLAEDLDRDGQMDLINADKIDGAVEILPGERPGQFGTPIRLVVGRAPQALATGDFDRDGRIDVAVADRAGQTIAILLNRSPKPTPPRRRDDRAT